MSQNKKESYAFSRYSENQRIFLISIRQEKIIPAHGRKHHFKNPRIESGLREFWWNLLPGAYFLFEYSKKSKVHELHKLLIHQNGKGMYEEYLSMKEVPDWLYALISSLPEFDERSFNEKHTVYTTRRQESVE